MQAVSAVSNYMCYKVCRHQMGDVMVSLTVYVMYLCAQIDCLYLTTKTFAQLSVWMRPSHCNVMSLHTSLLEDAHDSQVLSLTLHR